MKIEKVLKFIWREFIYGGHFQCLGSASIAYISAFLLKIKITFELLLLVYLIFYPIYINDRFWGIKTKTDELTNLERSKHFKGYFQLMPKISLFSILLLMGLLFYFGNFDFILFSLLLLFFGLLYPLYFKNLTRKIIGFKNFYVSSFFAVMALSPLIYYSYNLNFSSLIPLALLMVFIYLKTLWMQILLDIKDIETDKLKNLLTFPIIIGREKIFIFLKYFSVFAAILILIPAIFLLNVFPLSFLLLFLIVPFNFYCLRLTKNQQYFGYILASGEFLFWLILILFGKAIL